MSERKPLVLNPPLNTTLIRDAAGLTQLKEFFSRCGTVIGEDIETTPVKDYFWRRIRTIQFGNQQEQYVIDLLPFVDNDSDALIKAQGHYGINLDPRLQPVIDAIRPVLCSSDFLKVGVNLAFEYECLYWLLGLRTWNFFGCDLAERCIWAGGHSLKDYGFYSMEELMGRYFSVQIDKTLQESFTMEGELTQAQVEYAALDTRFPLAIRAVQMLILAGKTPEGLLQAGQPGAAAILRRIGELGPKNSAGDSLLFGDNLTEIAQIENDAIGSFQDMHLYGERIDREKWLARTAEKEKELTTLIADLDAIFLPIVGSKHKIISDQDVATAEAKWKAQNAITPEEIALKADIRKEKDFTRKLDLETNRANLEAARKIVKEQFKKECSTLKKQRTAIAKLFVKCEGEALINYGSNSQLLKILVGMKGLKSLKDLEDETLQKFIHIPVMALIHKYHGLSKEIGTYGTQWATEWVTHPCKEEGWLHPGDGRLHSVFNQYDAETGRSSSEKPNGQNLPRNKQVRSCFIADPPDENIRISICCEADTEPKFNNGNGGYLCTQCRTLCETKPEEYVIVTADMSGAELRILADRANDPIWIGAFARGEDVHCVCTELIEGVTWANLALPECCYFKLHTDETVAKNPRCKMGDLQRRRCECPEHNILRDGMKPTNFGIPYGISARALSAQINKTYDETVALMAKHMERFPAIWAYVDNAGTMAKVLKKSFDMYGRRRIFPEPTWERAKEKAAEDREEKLRLPLEEAQKNIDTFTTLNGRKPLKEELWILTHMLPSSAQVANAYAAMHGSIERQGKNHEIQGTNATIAKVSMGWGYDSIEGKPFLWHTLPMYKAKLLKFVHDELVVQCPKRYSQTVAALIGDAFRRAAALKMKKVTMEFDYNIAAFWKK